MLILGDLVDLVRITVEAREVLRLTACFKLSLFVLVTDDDLTRSDGGTHFLPRIVELIGAFCCRFRLRSLIRLLLLVAVRILRCQVDIGLNVEAFIVLRAGEILMGKRAGIERQITALGKQTVAQ